MPAVTTLLLSLLITFHSAGGMTKFRVGYFEVAPDVMVKKDANNNTELDGFNIEIIKWLAADLDFTLEMVLLDYSEGFAGQAKEFLNKSLNLGLPTYGLREGRNKIMTYLYPFSYSPKTLLIPYPKHGSDPWSCAKPFQYIVWILLFVATVAVTVLFKLIATRSYIKDNSEVTLIYAIGILTNQGGYCSTKARSSSLAIAGLWCLAALVLVNAYSGSLITYMTAPKIFPVVNSLEEMAKRDDLQLLAISRSFIQVQMQSASGSLKGLSTNIARVPPTICGHSLDSDEFANCVSKVKHGDHVIAIDTVDASVVMQDDFKRSRECELTVMESSFSPTFAGFVVPLYTTQQLRNALDVSILKAASVGLLNKWSQKFYPVGDNPCVNFRHQPTTTRQITVVDMESAFIILGIGYGLSLIALLYESVHKKLTSR